MKMEPFLFQPKLVPKIWGGRRLETHLGKDLPPKGVFGESWEISAHPGDETPTVFPLREKGKTIRDLTEEYKEDFLGACWEETLERGFPLLYKFIDAEDVLSVQVHPDDAYAGEHEGDNGKTECWIILDAHPDSLIYRGFKPGTTLDDFDRLLSEGRLEECLHSFKVKPGDTVFLPARTVHAIGKGILLAELQQSSDVTYRVYDWNRLENGKPRPLHVEKAREVLDFSPPSHDKAEPLLTEELPGGGHREKLVECDKFILERYKVAPEKATLITLPEGRFALLSSLAGSGWVEWSGGSLPVPAGTSLLLPAALPEIRVSADIPLTVAYAYLPR